MNEIKKRARAERARYARNRTASGRLLDMIHQHIRAEGGRMTEQEKRDWDNAHIALSHLHQRYIEQPPRGGSQ